MLHDLQVEKEIENSVHLSPKCKNFYLKLFIFALIRPLSLFTTNLFLTGQEADHVTFFYINKFDKAMTNFCLLYYMFTTHYPLHWY